MDDDAPAGVHLLPVGTRLRDYEITGVVGEGGFGVVYLAFDHSLQRRVAVKEYMPTSMASRAAGSSAIVVKSERHLDTFRAGLRSFLNEARLLARFDHPSLLKVYRFWEENGTAYMAMPFYEGPTLKAALARLGRAPTEAELRAWLRPLVDALAVMHAAHCFHRDIAPDNILLTPRGPLLLDFGAARRVIGDMTHALTVVLKPGFAPIEQYGDVATMSQGAWTDFYALASVVYYAITGQPPVSSVERLMDDRLQPLAETAAGRYSAAFLRAIDAALAVRPQDRPQDDAQFRALLGVGRPDAPVTVPAALAAEPFATTQRQPRTSPAETFDDGRRSRLAESRTDVLPTQVLPTAIPPTEILPTSTPTTQILSRDDAVAAPFLVAAKSSTTASDERAGFDAAPRSAGPSGRPRRATRGTAWAAVAAIVVVACAWRWMRHEAEPATVAPGAPTAATSPARSAVIAPPVATPPPSALEAPAEQTAASEPDPSVATPSLEPTPNAVAPPPVAGDDTKRPAAAARPRRESGEAAAAVRPHREATDAPPRVVPARCSDILQKASLEPLTAEEAAYLKKECR